MNLAEALAVVDAAGGRLSLAGGRVNVAVDRELPGIVWEALSAHKQELLASLAAPTPEGDSRVSVEGRDLVQAALAIFPGSRVVAVGPRSLASCQPAGVDCCDRCGSVRTVDTKIHDGQSIRRDCQICGRFRRFHTWHGVVMP